MNREVENSYLVGATKESTKNDLKAALLYQPSLLASDSQDEFELLRDTIWQRIRPSDAIEALWTDELVEGAFETARLRRFKAAIVRSNRPEAIRSLLKRVTENRDLDSLAERYFSSKSVRRRIESFLCGLGLDVAAIDVEAYRLSMPDLIDIDRRIAELASRRDRCLQNIDNYRAGLATTCSRPELEEIDSGER